MTQWKQVLQMLENATGRWVTTHDIYDVGIKNPSQRIDEIENAGYRVERERVTIKGKNATRYRLASSDGALFDVPSRSENEMWDAA